MVKETNTNTNRNIELERPPFGTYNASRGESNLTKKNIDDLIVSLANAHENKRARQVVEWEVSQPANIYRTA